MLQRRGLLLSFADALILGLVQGLTEFLPVSSSGHLVLAREALGLEAGSDVSFEVVVHLGTLLSVLLLLGEPVRLVLRSLPRLAAPGGWGSSWREDAGFRLAVLVALATVPAVVVGLAGGDELERLFGRPDVVAALLVVTGILLWLTRGRPAKAVAAPAVEEPPAAGEVRPRQALAMGLAQAAAILPGVSRSGATIATGLLGGVDRRTAGTFSFLMAIPAILGAAVLKLDDITGGSVPAAALATGFVAAFASGCLALRVLLALVHRGRLWVFSPYLVLVGGGYLVFHASS